MKCPKCQAENRQGEKFSKECGSKIKISCPVRGKMNPPDSKFCDGCDQHLRGQGPAPPLDYSHPNSYTPRFLAENILTTRGSVERERKLFTVLAADVVNFTAISGKLDPEEIHGIMQREASTPARHKMRRIKDTGVSLSGS
jgi:hypothetical protein